MIKELCHDEAILSQRCEVATVEDESVAQDLIDTIKSLDDAGCLAANQIGVTKKVCVYLDDGKMRERKRDFVGFEAQMIQHMIDHCLGKLV